MRRACLQAFSCIAWMGKGASAWETGGRQERAGLRHCDGEAIREENSGEAREARRKEKGGYGEAGRDRERARGAGDGKARGEGGARGKREGEPREERRGREQAGRRGGSTTRAREATGPQEREETGGGKRRGRAHTDKG